MFDLFGAPRTFSLNTFAHMSNPNHHRQLNSPHSQVVQERWKRQRVVVPLQDARRCRKNTEDRNLKNRKHREENDNAKQHQTTHRKQTPVDLEKDQQRNSHYGSGDGDCNDHDEPPCMEETTAQTKRGWNSAIVSLFH